MNKEEFLKEIEELKLSEQGKEFLKVALKKDVEFTKMFELDVCKFFGGNTAVFISFNNKTYTLRFPTFHLLKELNAIPIEARDKEWPEYTFIEELKKEKGFDISKYGLTLACGGNIPWHDLYVCDDFDTFIENVHNYIF